MTGRNLGRVRGVLALAVVTLFTAGCMAAAAGAGAAAAIHMSGNNAQSQVRGTPAAVDADARAVFTEMGIQVSHRTEGPNGFEYHGTLGERQVHAELEGMAGGMTQVTVSVQRSPVEWDNDMARDIVRRIVARR